MILEMKAKNLTSLPIYHAQSVRHLLRCIYQKLKKMTTDLNKIVGNFRDILEKIRDILGNERVNTRVGDAHISITIIMVIRRAIPFRGIDSLESKHAGRTKGRHAL